MIIRAQYTLDPIAAGGEATVLPGAQPSGIGQSMFNLALRKQDQQEQRKYAEAQQEKAMEQARAAAREKQFQEQIKSLVTQYDKAWEQDIPTIGQAVNDVTKTYAEYRAQGIDPLDAGKNPEAFMAFQKKIVDTDNLILQSKGDKAFYELTQKNITDKADYNNPSNLAKNQAFKEGKLGERKGFQLDFNYDEMKLLKDVFGPVGMEEITVTIPGVKTNTIKTEKRPKADALFAATTSILTSQGPAFDKFRQAIAADMENASEAQLKNWATTGIALATGQYGVEAFSPESVAEVLADPEQLRAYAIRGRAAIKGLAVKDKASSVKLENNPEWMVNGGGGKAGDATTFGIFAKQAENSFAQSKGSISSSLSALAKSTGGKVADSGNAVIMNVALDKEPQVMPTTFVTDITGTPLNNKAGAVMGTAEQVEMLYGVKDRYTGTIRPVSDQELAQKPELKPLVRTYSRVKYRPYNVPKTVSKFNQYGQAAEMPNEEYQDLVNKGYKPEDMQLSGQFYKYFDMASETDVNELNLIQGQGAFTKQKSTSKSVK